MNGIPRLAGATCAALLLALLGGCATADPARTGDPTTAPDPGPGPDPAPLPVETNEVRLTWVETGGASRITIELPDDLPYFPLFSVDAEGGNEVLVESVVLDPAGEFAVSDDGCSGVAVVPDAPCFVSLVLDVDAVGVYEAVLRVTPAGGATASIPVLVEVEDDVVDPDPEETDGTDGTDGEDSAPLE
jgi:hypothetical protein